MAFLIFFIFLELLGLGIHAKIILKWTLQNIRIMEGHDLDSFGVKCGSCEKNNVIFMFLKARGVFGSDCILLTKIPLHGL
jgi:hypothetical protein